MQIKRHIFLFIFKLLPSTRLYDLKINILRLGGLHVGVKSKIVSSVKFMGIKDIFIGEKTFVGHDTIISGGYESSVKIGSSCDISSKVSIITGTHELDLEGERIAGKGYSKDIIIENGVWIGVNSTILPGVTIGEKSIVAAGSIVTKNVPSGVLVAGNPAVVKRKLRNE
ncbi:hypothetical protein OAA_10285 [Vibrio cyclitrophicus 1F175]|uniref:DapH/DapD/GlmU-related protein n=1 Tax=Vibrio cyclitrophicus TaxID=47951 RepID=UPI00036E6036|nr:DapH/DapD/GlmU-related protein [Vibrio cyclitrophicus]OEF64771.1 hypothetical protein OAA_10285 [Vibrio cyclitrophicus 1F175]PMH72860.1 hypothetical protein BCU60_22035 [Vibrio cyclitrophicus]